mgnify:CR=1 FL=1
MLQKRTNSGQLLLMPALTLLLTTAISLLFSTHVEAQKTTPAKTEKAEPAKPVVTPPAVKQPGAPKAETMWPKPPKREIVPVVKPKKSPASRKEDTVRFPAPKDKPANQAIKEVPLKIEEVYVENIHREPKRINVSGNVNTITSVKTISTDPRTVTTVKGETAVSTSPKVEKIRLTVPSTITKVRVGSPATISPEAKEDNGKQAASIVLRGQPSKNTASSK